MWGFLEKLSEQVNKYATFFGQLWYVLVFVFRAIVVMSLGGSVYGDELGAFQCSTQIVGCETKCYNDFAKISHMRFWAFQLIAVVAPTVFFHFYSAYVMSEIEKLKSAEENIKKLEEGGDDAYLSLDAKAERDIRKMSRRKKAVGNVKTRKVMDGQELKEVPYTSKIHWMYFVTVIARIIIEGVFIWLAFLLFRYMVVDCDNIERYGDAEWCDKTNPFLYLWMEVPAVYECRDLEVCRNHINAKGEGYVPCYVSRPYEKTVFLRYMGVLSGLCFVVSIIELCVILSRKAWKVRKASVKRRQQNTLEIAPPHNDRYSNPYYPASNPPGPYGNRQLYSGLAVPVRITSRQDDPIKDKKNSVESLTASLKTPPTKTSSI